MRKCLERGMPMNLDKLIMDTLRPLGVPIAKLRYNQNANTYITFMEYNQAGRMSADDEEIITKHFYQVDVFSNTDFTDLVNNVRQELTGVGFRRMFESETFDEDMNMFRAIIRFNYEGEIK